MSKTFLLEYSSPKFFTLSDLVDYDLRVEVISFFGLRKTTKTIKYRVWDHEPCKAYFDHWDYLIKNHKQLINKEC